MRALRIAKCLLIAGWLCGCGGAPSELLGGTNSGSSCDGAPEGSYQCSGNTGISVCKKGSWEYATSCTCTIYDGDPRKPPYPSRCATNFDVANSVECVFAFKTCMSCTPGSGCH